VTVRLLPNAPPGRGPTAADRDGRACLRRAVSRDPRRGLPYPPAAA